MPQDENLITKLYIREFSNAVKKTATENYLLPSELIVLGKYKPYRSNDTYESLYQLLLKYFAEPDGTIDLTKVKGQCLKSHFQMSSIIQKEFNVRSVLTIGYVTFLNQDYYKFETINNCLIRQLSNTNQNIVDIHVWLTLPSYEIIDLTFLAHFTYLHANSEMKEELKKATDFPYYFGSADYLYSDEEIVYHPKYVGEDVLIKNGFLRV